MSPSVPSSSSSPCPLLWRDELPRVPNHPPPGRVDVPADLTALHLSGVPDPVAAEVTRRTVPCPDFDLSATLDSGQAFRWAKHGDSWIGVLGQHWIRLTQRNNSLLIESPHPSPTPELISHYLGLADSLHDILQSFPDDPPLKAAVHACHGLRLLRQDPWECLASFILSATKQITQIRQVVSLLCTKFGDPIPTPPDHPPTHAFPSPDQIARLSEPDLRACRMGFRAPHLLHAARTIATGKLNLNTLSSFPLDQARNQLLQLRGVGPKIADCTLLFSCNQPQAFPIDVWIARTLRHDYFQDRPTPMRRLQEFAQAHFGPHAGYAQQYLFHYARLHRSFSA